MILDFKNIYDVKLHQSLCLHNPLSQGLSLRLVYIINYNTNFHSILAAANPLNEGNEQRPCMSNKKAANDGGFESFKNQSVIIV